MDIGSVYLAYILLGAIMLALSVGAGRLKARLWLSGPLLATLAGVVVGPAGLNWFNGQQWHDSSLLLEEVARFTLAMSLMGVALRLPNRWVWLNYRALLTILLVGMPLMWLIASACAVWLLGLPWLSALLLGAILTPTDPVVASSIVTGRVAERGIDADVRHFISAESGANDGLAFVLLMLPVLMLERPLSDAMTHWATHIVVFEVIGAIAVGVGVGLVVGRLVDWMYSHATTERGSLLAVTVALSLLLLGGVAIVEGDGILAVFAGGLAFNWVIREEEGHDEAHHERLQSTLSECLDVPVFVLFGILLPLEAWQEFGWPVAMFVAALLLFKRLPVMLLLYPRLSSLKSLRDALFTGWFGPVAVATMVYATWAQVREGQEQLWHIASLVILVSIVVHGVTATPLTRWYARQSARAIAD